MIMKNCKFHATWDTKEKLMEKECSIYHALMESPQLLSLLKLQWQQLLSVLKDKNESSAETETYDQKEMTRFCAEVFSLATSEKTLTGIASVVKLNTRDFETEHYMLHRDYFCPGNTCTADSSFKV